MAKKQAPLKTPDTSQFDNLVKKAQEESKSSGIVPDYDKINEEAGGAITGFQGAQGLYSIEKPDFYDSYEDYVDRNTLRGGQFDVDALNAIRAENQSNWEQAGNALGRLAVNVVPQIIGSAAAMLDLPGYFSAEEAANNSIVKWADSIKQASNEALPIYEENPAGSMQMGDFAWWMTRGEGLVESIAAFAASGAGAGKLMSLGAKGLARGLAATVMSAKKAQQVSGLTSTVGAATMMNQAEAVLEATQVYQTTYNNSLAKGKSATQAKEEAARAAATTMNINRANILLNLTSAKAFLKPMGGTRNLLTAPTLGGTLAKVGLEGAQEAVEETVNLVAQKAGEAKGRGEKDYMAQGMKAIGTMEGLEAAFLGAIGGVGNTAITSALHGSKYGPGAVVDENGNKISYNENLRQQYQKQQQVIEELKQNGVKVTDALMNLKERMQFEDELYQAARAGDQAKVEELQEKMFENTALKAFSSGTTDILEEQLKEEMSKDPAEVGPEYIENAKRALENLTQLEDIYNNYENYSNVKEIFQNKAQEQRLNRASNIIGKQTKNAQVSFAQKVRDIAQKYKFTEEYDQITKEEGVEVSRKKQTRETPLNYVFDDLENNQGDSEENKKTYDKFLKEVKSTPEYEYYEGYKSQSENIAASLASNQAEFNKIISPKYQEEYANKQAEKEKLKTLNAELANAATITDVEKLKAQTNDETFNQLADQKIAEIEKSNAAEAKRKQTELTLQELRAKINAGTAETYDEVDKAIEDADISQANKDALRIAHSNHLERLANPQINTDPLAMFQQDEDAETTTTPINTTQTAVNQNNKNLTTQLPTDLPQPAQETAQVESEVINTAETLVQQDPTLLLGQDENGNLIFNYSKSAEGYNRGAFLSRDFNQEESVGIVDREEFTNELEDNPIVLDPDALAAGTKLILSVDHDYDGVKYDPTSATREKTSWIARLAELRQLATQRNVSLEQLPEYIAEVPIKVMTETGETVFYVHDNAWYRNENLDNTPEAIQNDKSKNYKIRAAVVKKGTVKSQVSYKSYGRLFKTADGKSIPVTEAMPDSKLVIAVGKDGSYEFADDPKNLLGKKYKILNKQDTQPGRPYAIVKVGPNEHIAIPLERNKVSAEVAKSIRFAAEAYLTGDASNPVVQAIGAATGIDITDALGLGQYMNMFTYMFPLDKNADLETLLMQGGSKSTLKSNTPIITVNPNGLEFGLPGVMLNKYTDINGVEQQRYGAVISRNFESTAIGKKLNQENLTRLENILQKALSNVRIEALMQNTPAVVVLDNQGQTRSDNYLDHIKASTSSNVISANIGTEENPKWIYTIQPTILFETKFAGNLANKVATTAKKVPTSIPNAAPAAPIVVQPVAPVAAPVATQPTATAVETDIEAQKADIERRRQESLKPKSEENPDGYEEGERIEEKDGKRDFFKYYSYFYEHPINEDDFENIESSDLNELLNKINAKYDAELAALEKEDKLAKLNAMNASMASSLASAVKPQIVSELDNEAEQILDQEGLKLSDIEGFITNINNKVLPAEWYTNVGFRDASHALQVFERAAELFKERANQDVKTITLPNGLVVKVDKNTKDANSISDDSFDDMLISLSEDQVDTVVAEVRNNVIEGIDPNTQDSLKSYIAADIMKRALALKEVGDKKSLETSPVFEEHKKSLEELAKFYREAGFPNKAAKLEAVVNQFDKLRSVVNQYMSTLTTGKVSEDLGLNDSEESVGLEKTVYSDDWAFTINSKATASADLRKFFAFVEARNADGTVMTNALGFPEIIPFDQVYDALHMMLANKPADLDIMMDTLELYAERAPWVQTVIDNLEKAPERIKNEFVSDMTKHHIGMNFIMWTKDNNGRYSLQRWNSNSSSIEERLRDTWYSNLRSVGSNLLVLNDEGEYEYNAEVADDLISLAKSWEQDPKAVTDDELAQWLGNFGIVLSENTYKDLRAGKYNNSGRKPWTTLFTASTGLVKVLATELQKAVEQGVLVDDHKILKDSAIKALAKLEAINTNNVYSNSFRSGIKTIYSYGNNNYLVNRMRDLTSYDEDSKKFLNPDLIENLKAISFTQDSIWLNNLVDEGEMGTLMRSALSADYLSLEALKQQYTKSKDNRKLNNLNTDEHEIVKLGMFFNGSKIKIGNKYYRRVSYLYPTMSDKTTMLTINALAETITVTTEGLAKSNLETLYNALVQPEINRMQGKKSKNISGYTPEYFYFLPSLNTLEVEVNGVDFKNFRDLVINGSQSVLNEVKDQVLEHLQQTFSQLVNQKLDDWNNLNIGKTLKDSNNKVTDQYTFLDKEYMKSHAKGVQNQKVYHAAADYVYNSLIANSEIMKLFTGDPALYAKFKKDSTLAQNLEATFINMGKRLAGDIAPGIELADSASNSYFQVFLEDKKIDSNNLKDKVQAEFFQGIDPKYKEGYSNIEGSDAQEYTTWKEHLYVLKQLGRLTQAQYDKLTDKLTKQSAGIINKSTKLTYEETQVVLQPMKPVYVGNITSKEDNADRRVYIKSSSFPLIPEFTTGFQINKLRAALEKFEEDNKNSIAKDGSSKFVRASFGTANKVGAVSNPIQVFDKDGNVLDNLTIATENILELPRANFRIQQDVPYKREKNEVNIGTQERKLLFVNLLDVKVSDGKTGKDLMAEYNTAYEELFKHAQEKLMKQLGLVEEVAAQDVLQQFNDVTIDPTIVEKTMEALDTISKIKSPIKKQTAIEEIEEEIGADNLERINFINQNFDKIVEGLVDSKINYFFDDNNEFKNCD